MSVNVGTIEGVLKLKDEFTAAFDRAASTTQNQSRRVNASLESVRRETDKLSTSTQKYGSAVSNVSRLLGALGVTVGAGLLLRKSITEAADASKEFARLQSVLKSTGGAIGLTAQEANALADSLSRNIGVDNDVIVGVESMMLRYTRLGKDIFPEAIELAFDMATANEVVVTSSEQLSGEVGKIGKMLGDTSRAVMLLKREGKGLTEEQYRQILNFRRMNDFAGEQRVILQHLQTIYGGNARALRQEMGGALQATQVAWNNLLEAFGKGLFVDTSSVNDLADTLSDPALQDSVQSLGEGFGVIAGGLAEITKLIGPLIRGLVELEKMVGPLQILSRMLRDIKSQKPAGNVYGPFTPIGQAGGAGNAPPPGPPVDPAEIKRREELLKQFQAELASIRSAIDLNSKLSDVYAGVNKGILATTRGHELLSEEVKRATQAHELHKFELEATDKFGKKLAATLVDLKRAELESSQAAETAAKITEGRLKEAERLYKAVKKAATDLFEVITKADQAKLSDAFTVKDQQKEVARSIATEYEKMVSSIAEALTLRKTGIATELQYQRILAQILEQHESMKLAVSREIEDLRLSVEGSSMSTALVDAQRRYDDWLRRIEQAEKDRLITVEQSSEAIALAEEWLAGQRYKIQQDNFSGILSNASQALGFLADRFGGFFKYLQDLVNGLQQAQGFGKSVEGLFGGSKFAGAAGGIATVIGIAAVIYDMVDKLDKARRARKYEGALGFEVSGGRVSADAAISYAGRDVIKAIRNMVRSIESALRISIEEMDEIGIKVRRDGERFKAYFKGQLLGVFGSLEEALQEAFQEALLDPDTVIRGLSDLMRQALQEASPTSLPDDFMDFMTALREISDLGLADGLVQLQDFTRHLDELFDRLRDLREITPAVIQGYANLVAAEIRATQAYADSLMGRERTAAQQLADRQAEARMFLAEGQLRIANLRLDLARLQQEREVVRARGTMVRIAGDLARTEIEIGRTLFGAKAELLKAELTLQEIELAAIDAAIAAINSLIPEIERILASVDPDKIKLPRAGRGGRGGSDQLADMIREVNFQFSLRNASDYARQLAEINRRWDEAIRGAGRLDGAEARARRTRDEAIRAANGNAEAIRRANEAYERTIRSIGRTREEIERANEAREREIQILNEQRIRDVVSQFREFLGLVTPFDQVRQTAADLIKSIQESPFGDERKASMIARVLANVEKQIERMSREMAVNLFGQLIGDLEKYGADAALISEAQRQMAILEHYLKLENYRAEFEILKAQGKLSAEVLAAMGQAIEFLGGIDPTKFIGPVVQVQENFQSASDSADEAAKALDQLKEAFRRAKDGIREFLDGLRRGEAGIIAPVEAFNAARDQYMNIVRLAERGQLEGFEKLPEAAQNYIDALKSFSPARAAIELPSIMDTLERMSNATTVKNENLIFTEKFAAEQVKTNQLLDSHLTDLTVTSKISNAQQADMLEKLERISGNQSELNARLARLESAQTGQKRAA